MENKKIDLKQLIITAAIMVVVAVVSPLIVSYVQTAKPKLVYVIPETNPFQGADKNFAIYNISLSNSGGTIINDVKSVIQVPNSSLDEIKVNAVSTLEYSKTVSLDELTLEIKSLNPTENINISILASSQTDMPKKPIVSVRGTGIIGREETSSTSTISSILDPISTILTFITMIFVLLIRWRGNSFFTSDKHSEEQNKILAYLCGIYGLTSDVDRYLTNETDEINTSYWSEADRFASIAIANPTSDETNKRKKVLINLIEYARIATSSLPIIHYNIARIAFAQNEIEEAKSHLLLAKKTGGNIIKIRLKIEPNLMKLLNNIE